MTDHSTSVALELEKWARAYQIAEEQAADIRVGLGQIKISAAHPANSDVCRNLQSIAVYLVRRIPKDLLEKVVVPGRPTVRYADGWWQAFRERWFPAWALARWPVEYVVYRGWDEQTIDAGKYFPGLDVPNERGYLRLNIFDSPFPDQPAKPYEPGGGTQTPLAPARTPPSTLGLPVERPGPAEPPPGHF